jgi:hypothetical protein
VPSVSPVMDIRSPDDTHKACHHHQSAVVTAYEQSATAREVDSLP